MNKKQATLKVIAAASGLILSASAVFDTKKGFKGYIKDAGKAINAYAKIVKKAGHSTATDAMLLEIADTFAKAVAADYIAEFDGFAPGGKKFVDCVGAEESDEYFVMMRVIDPSSRETSQYKLMRKRMAATAMALLTSHVANKNAGKPLSDPGVKATIAVLKEIVTLAKKAGQKSVVEDLGSVLKTLPASAKAAGGAPAGFGEAGLGDAKAMLKMAKAGKWYAMMDEVFYHSEELGGDEEYPWADGSDRDTRARGRSSFTSWGRPF